MTGVDGSLSDGPPPAGLWRGQDSVVKVPSVTEGGASSRPSARARFPLCAVHHLAASDHWGKGGWGGVCRKNPHHLLASSGHRPVSLAACLVRWLVTSTTSRRVHRDRAAFTVDDPSSPRARVRRARHAPLERRDARAAATAFQFTKSSADADPRPACRVFVWPSRSPGCAMRPDGACGSAARLPSRRPLAVVRALAR